MFATGAILGEALAAAEKLAQAGIKATVVDVHTIKPFDSKGVAQLVNAHAYVLTIEEHTVVGGLGAAVAEASLEHGAQVTAFARIGLKDIFPSVVGDQVYLRNAYDMDANAIAEAGQRILSSKEVL